MPEFKIPQAKALDAKTTAYATGRNLAISTKWCMELGRFIKGLPVEKAKKVLEEVAALKKPVPIRRHKTHVAHKPNIGSGRFPANAALAMAQLLASAAANAENKGLVTDKLYVKNVIALKASSFYRPRLRWRPQKRKNTNLVVIVEEKE